MSCFFKNVFKKVKIILYNLFYVQHVLPTHKCMDASRQNKPLK